VIEGAVLHRYEFGQGDPLVALHGVYGTGRRFADLAERLGTVRIVAPDLRGHGQSRPDPPWRLEQHVADVLATVADVPRFDLLGFSFGGAVATHLAVTAPARVRRLLLLDPSLGLDPDYVLPRARAALRYDEFGSPAEAETQLAAALPYHSVQRIAEQVADSLVATEDGRWRWRTEGAAVVTAFSESCRQVPDLPAGMPVLLVRAGQVPRGSAPSVAAWAGVSSVRVVTLDSGHQMLANAADQVAMAVAEFLESTPG
jgi:lipase